MLLNVAFVITIIFSLLLTGCSNGISKEKVKSAIYNLENCLKECDQKEAACTAKLKDCLSDCSDNGERCRHLYHEGSPEFFKCLAETSQQCLARHQQCLAEYRTCMNEVIQCRKDCQNKFPLELGIK